MERFAHFHYKLLTLIALVIFQTVGAQDCVSDPTLLGVRCAEEEALVFSLPEGSQEIDFILSLDDVVVDILPPCNVTTDVTLGWSHDYNGLPPNTTELQFSALGFYEVDAWIADDAGHHSYCRRTVRILDPVSECNAQDDTTSPALTCLDTIRISLSPLTNEFMLMANPPQLGAIGVDELITYHDDNCGYLLWLRLNLLEESTGEPQIGYQKSLTAPGVYDVEVWVSDQYNNASSCISRIVIEENDGFCVNDTNPPLVTVPATIQTMDAIPGEDVQFTRSDLQFVSLSDNCSEVTVTFAEDDPFFNYWDLSYTDTLTVRAPYTGQIWVKVTDTSGNSTYFSQALISLTPATSIMGQVYFDENNNCSYEGGEIGPAGWTVEVRNLEDEVIANTQTTLDGYYTIYLDAVIDDYEVAVRLPEGVGSNCPTVLTLPGGENMYEQVNFAVRGVSNCEYLAVDISTPFLRRCFDNVYAIHYVNYSEFPVDDATVQIRLNESMNPLPGPDNYTIIEDGIIEFDLGTLAASTAGMLQLNIYLECDADLGATHCVEAVIEPFTCTFVTDFADLVITGTCDEDNGEVNFKVENKGSGGMGEEKGIIVTEDIVTFLDPPTVILGPGQSETFTYPANGATWRAEIEQDSSNPYGGIAADFVEGCNGFTQGIPLQFPLATEKPNSSIDCQENISSFDPNDKQAFPYGMSEHHFIEENVPIDYMIRFQNTGTDTAFNIKIEDRLSPHLDFTSISPGSSSHPYRMELTQDGWLTLYFENIMLPDSNVNEKTSKGFVKFSVEQLLENPPGTEIENVAAIYFDFNEPIVTNTVFHTIGEEFITVGVSEPDQIAVYARLFPHPLAHSTTIDLYGYEVQEGVFTLFDALGRTVMEKSFVGQQLKIAREEVPSAGVYFFKINDGLRTLITDRIVVH